MHTKWRSRYLAFVALFASCEASRTPDVAVQPPLDAGSSETTSDAQSGMGAATDAGVTDGPSIDASSDAAAPDASAPWTTPFGMLTLNLHCLKTEGTPFANNTERFAAIADAVQKERISVIVAQEICETSQVSARTLLQSALATATGAAWTSEFAFAHQAWTGTPDEAQEGLAIFVRGVTSQPETVRYATQGALTRVMLGVSLPPELGGLRVYSVHLDVGSADVRAVQARESVGAALEATDPGFGVLVGGDLNDVPGSSTHQGFLGGGFRELTATSADQIDHIFAHRGAPVTGAHSRKLFDGTTYPPVSDHEGFAVDITPGAGEKVQPTRLIASTSVDAGFVAVRGEKAPLSWTRGWPARRSSSGWKLVVTELGPGPFEYKFLVDDATWQVGPNLAGNGGADNSASPMFP